jgi:RNA polymerase sigma factor (sigma-70 family)
MRCAIPRNADRAFFATLEETEDSGRIFAVGGFYWLMTIKETDELIRDYVKRGSEEAFKELVDRYINLVYSAALRRTGPDSNQIEDIVQTVFADFARKAVQLPKGVLLGGWLHQHTCFVASNMLRADLRRQNREKEAMREFSNENVPDRPELVNALDEAVEKLNPPDRDILLLRYFEGEDLRTVGTHFGVSEDAAQKRVSRAIERLRSVLVDQGVAVGATTLVALLGTCTSNAAPGTLNGTVCRLAIRNGLPVSVTLFGLSTGTILKSLGIATVTSLALLWTWYRPIAAFSKSQAAKKLHSRTNRTYASASPLGTSLPQGTVIAKTNKDTNNLLTLKILADDSGSPVPNVPMDFRLWEGTQQSRRKLQSDRYGQCEIEISRANLTELRITTRIDDFADTRLDWKSENGDLVPANYTIRLIRPAAISGIVVNEQNQPVEGATIDVETYETPALENEVESHIFGQIETLSDSNGRWRINRIASEMIPFLQGRARHPEYVGAAAFRMDHDDPVEKALRDGTHVFRLARGASVRGWVTDSQGNGIAGASILVGFKGEDRSRQSISESDGSFLVSGCTRQKTSITAEANGYAATTLPIEIDDRPQPKTIRLLAGKILRVQVLDLSNNPIPNAMVTLDTHRQPHPVSELIVASQASFSGITDTAGRLAWDGAPDSELVFNVVAQGFGRLELKVHPDGMEHLVVLKPALTVAGFVTDSETQKGIAHFKLITGWPRRGMVGEPIIPMWSPFDRYWFSFSNGEFRHVFEDHFIRGEHSYIFKIEASGYVPFVSKVVNASEGEVRLDVVLKRSAAIRLTLLTPTGYPAGGAQVGLGITNRFGSLSMTGTGFESQDSDRLLKVDDKGAFDFELNSEVVQIFAFHAQGFVEVSPETLRAGSTLRLKPWGHVEGTISYRGRFTSSCRVNLRRVAQDGALLDVLGKAGTDGKFRMDQVPAGRFKLYAHPEGDPRDWSDFYQGPLGQLEVRAEETTRVEF